MPHVADYTDLSRNVDTYRGVDAWHNSQQESKREYPSQLFNVLLAEQVITPEKLADSMVFWGSAANSAWIEIQLAKMIDSYMEELDITPAVKPLVYASDINDFTKYLPEPELSRVSLVRMQHEAAENPLPSGQIDVIFDRLGALWHFLDLYYTHDALLLLSSYALRLKEQGVIVLDNQTLASSSVSRVCKIPSTARLLRERAKYQFLQFLSDSGLEISHGDFTQERSDQPVLILKKK